MVGLWLHYGYGYSCGYGMDARRAGKETIERVIVHEDCTFTVEFKSGTQVEIA